MALPLLVRKNPARLFFSHKAAAQMAGAENLPAQAHLEIR
jgi:hypothetical protein